MEYKSLRAALRFNLQMSFAHHALKAHSCSSLFPIKLYISQVCDRSQGRCQPAGPNRCVHSNAPGCHNRREREGGDAAAEDAGCRTLRQAAGVLCLFCVRVCRCFCFCAGCASLCLLPKSCAQTPTVIPTNPITVTPITSHFSHALSHSFLPVTLSLFFTVTLTLLITVIPAV